MNLSKKDILKYANEDEKKTLKEARLFDWHPEDILFRGFTFKELIDAVHSNEPIIDENSIMKVFNEILSVSMEDAKYELKENMGNILSLLKK